MSVAEPRLDRGQRVHSQLYHRNLRVQAPGRDEVVEFHVKVRRSPEIQPSCPAIYQPGGLTNQVGETAYFPAGKIVHLADRAKKATEKRGRGRPNSEQPRHQEGTATAPDPRPTPTPTPPTATPNTPSTHRPLDPSTHRSANPPISNDPARRYARSD